MIRLSRREAILALAVILAPNFSGSSETAKLYYMEWAEAIIDKRKSPPTNTAYDKDQQAIYDILHSIL